MASEFKELNNLYTKRPAVALFRKPFANNDEMSDILEGMLDIYASVEQQSISKYKAPKYKAIYWNHLSGKPIFEMYGEIVLFNKGSFANDKTRASLKSKILAKKLKDLSSPSSTSEVLVENWDGRSSEGNFLYSYNISKSDLSTIEVPETLTPESQTQAKINYTVDTDTERFRKARTFDLWVLDPQLQVILDNQVITATRGVNTTTTTLPYLDFFESVKEISASKFSMSAEGLKVVKDLKKSGIKEYKMYEVTLKDGIIWQKYTAQKVKDALCKFDSDFKDYVDWNSVCNAYKDYITKLTTSEGVLDTNLKDYFLYSKEYVAQPSPGLKPSQYLTTSSPNPREGKNMFRISISDSWFLVSKFLSHYLKDTSFFNTLKNKLVSGSLVFSEYGTQEFPYKTASGDSIKIKYTNSLTMGKYIGIYRKDLNNFLVKDLINVYLLLCQKSGSVELNKSIQNNIGDKEETSLNAFGFDSPLRLNSFSNKGDYQTKTGLLVDYTSQPITRLTSLYDVARIRASINPEVEIKTKLKKNLTHGAIPNVLDFKLEYYAKIYEKYIKPRYEKYQEFIDSGLMKVYPCDIIDYGDYLSGLLEDKDAVLPAIKAWDIKSYRTSRYATMSSEEKLELINYFESVLFNNYSGFYTTSTTPLSETVSPYSNTYIDESNISTDYNDQAALMLAAISSLGSKGDIYSDINNVNNKDVSSIALSRQTKGKSSASLVVKNLNSKYCFSKGKYAGDIIFEPMDELFIYLPTFDNKIVLSFKGFIDSAQYINDKGYHSIGIQASCPMKKLELVRTNVRPSLSSAENSNAAIHPFTVPKELYESIDKWAPFMFMQALTFYSSMLKQSTIEDENIYIYTVDKDTKLPKFYDTLLQFLWYRQTNAPNTQERASSALIELTSKYTATETFVAGQPISSAFMEGSNSLFEMYDKVSSKDGNTNFKATYNIFAQRSDGYTPINKTLVAQLLGTLQPAWVIGSQDVNIVFSDYRTNLDILTETADKFNCYIYSDKNGVVQFRPPQISLMNLNCTTYDNMSTLSTDRILQNNDYRYEVRPDMIDSQTTTAYHTQCDDSSLVTWLQLSGQNIWGCLNADNGNAVVIQDIPKSLKYGIKTQQEQILSGIEKKEALYIYGLSLLDRQNSLFRSGNIAGLASGDMDINVSMYSPIDNTVYLADGLTINYNAGGSLTYNIPLKWGRKPLFEIPLKTTENKSTEYKTPQLIDIDPFSNKPVDVLGVYKEATEYYANIAARSALSQFNNIIDYKKLRELLLKSVKNHEITSAYYFQLISYLDYVEEYPNNDYILSSFMFNGYVWDGISSISFEDLILTYFGSLLSQDSGFEIAFGINGRGLTDAQAREVIGKADKKPQRILTIHGGEVFNVVIPNGSNREKQISIYANPKRKY